MKQRKEARTKPSCTVPTPYVRHARRSTRLKTPHAYVRQKLPAVPKDVPVFVKEKEDHRHSSSENIIRLAFEAERALLGPMPVDQFLRSFLPLPSTENTPSNSHGMFDGITRHSLTAHELCIGLAEAFERNGCCPSVKFVPSILVQRDANQFKFEPEMVGYARDEVNLVSKDEARSELNVGLAEICIQVKLDYDPFCDYSSHDARPEDKLETSFLAYKNHGCYWRSDKHARRELRAFGGMVAQATEVCARQHRVFLFSMMIIGTRARLFRWDRAGVIVTESFDYVQNPMFLCEFLWRFSHATPVQRGYDPTVTVASAKEERLFKDNIAKEVAFQLGIKRSDEKFAEAMKRHYEVGKVAKVKVFDDKGNRSEWIECLVSVPVASPRSVMGCGTRGYWAVILTGRRKGDVVFLKDIWRINSSANIQEGEIYDEMMEADVENISKNLYDGDVLYGYSESGSVQTTLSQDYINESWMNETLKYTKREGGSKFRIRVYKHAHYRLVLEDVGYPLSEFTGSRELFEAARDVIIALISAYEQCNRLHRDVSINNIILVRRRGLQRRKGVLIDWELSSKADGEGCSTDYARSGTWAFMSAASLKSREATYRHTRGDDFESVLYVLIFASLHWLGHNYDDRLGAWIDRFFYDSLPWVNGGHNGGFMKSRYITDGGFTDDFEFSTEGISAFFSDMYVDLGSTSPVLRKRGFQSTWMADRIMKHFDNVCRFLASIPDADQDRCTNDATDYYRDLEDSWTSQTSESLVSDAVPSVISEGLADNSPHYGKKRAFLEEDDGLGADNESTTGDWKRRRIDYPNEQALSNVKPDSWKAVPSPCRFSPSWNMKAEEICAC